MNEGTGDRGVLLFFFGNLFGQMVSLVVEFDVCERACSPRSLCFGVVVLVHEW